MRKLPKHFYCFAKSQFIGHCFIGILFIEVHDLPFPILLFYLKLRSRLRTALIVHNYIAVLVNNIKVNHNPNISGMKIMQRIRAANLYILYGISFQIRFD